MLKQILVLILSSSSAMAKSSFEFFSRGRLSKASQAIQEELPNAKEEEVERLLDLALNILSHSKENKLREVVKIFKFAQRKKLSPILVQRISYDLKALRQWSRIKKLSADELRKKIEEMDGARGPLLTPNLENRSMLRIYNQMALWQNSRKKDPRWMLASAKAQYALSKGGHNILKEIRSLENLPTDIKADVERMIEELAEE